MASVQRQDYVPNTTVHLPPLQGQSTAPATMHAVAHQAVRTLSNNAGSAVAGALGGASQIPGNDIQSVLANLVAMLKKLVELVQQMVQQKSGSTGGAAGDGPVQQADPGCGMDMGGKTGGGSTPPPVAQNNLPPAMPATAAPVAAAAPAARAAAVAPSSNSTAFEQRVMQLINQQRAANGLSPVSQNSILKVVADKHNATQVESRTMAHIGVGDGDPGARFRSEGFYGAWGENVAVGQSSPEQVVSEWMNSPTHRANILNPNYHQVGIAYNTTQDGYSFWSQEFGA
ncbi:MAG: hypothetical protein H7123_05970 [Thermoleophilia bacterium]|nr:hypothetical protein [Thermoleophilia bacterium]